MAISTYRNEQQYDECATFCPWFIRRYILLFSERGIIQGENNPQLLFTSFINNITNYIKTCKNKYFFLMMYKCILSAKLMKFIKKRE